MPPRDAPWLSLKNARNWGQQKSAEAKLPPDRTVSVKTVLPRSGPGQSPSDPSTSPLHLLSGRAGGDVREHMYSMSPNALPKCSGFQPEHEGVALPPSSLRQEGLK